MERTDSIGFGGRILVQDSDEFCYGIDAVLLADFAAETLKSRGRRGHNGGAGLVAADLGSGNAVIPLILEYKCKKNGAGAFERIYAVEKQKSSFEKAERNARLNGLGDTLRALHADVKESDAILSAISADLGAAAKCDLVTMNPPYVERGRGIASGNEAQRTARQETTAALEDFLALAAAMLKEKALLCAVNSAARLADMLCLCRKYGLEPKRLRLVAPSEGKNPNLALLACVKGGGRDFRVLPQLCVYEGDGKYTREILEIYEKSY